MRRAVRGNREDKDMSEDLIIRVCENFTKQLETSLSKRFDEFDKKLSEVSNTFKTINNRLSEHSEAIKCLEARNDVTEQFRKRNALRLIGIEEAADNEDPVDLVIKFINKSLDVTCQNNDIDSAFRIGKKKQESHRAILVNFVRNIKKNEVYNAKRKLKGTQYSLFEDLTPDRYELLLAAKKKLGNTNVWTSGGHIYAWNERQRKKIVIHSENDF